MRRRTGLAAIAGGFAVVLLIAAFVGTSSAVTVLHVQDFAGYQTYKPGATTATTTFTVPTVTCGASTTGIEPGVEATVAPNAFTTTAYLYGATLKMTCAGGALSVVEAMFASGLETDYTHAVRPGDSLTASFMSSASGSTVTLQDTTLGHTFKLTDSGAESYATSEYMGVQAVSISGQFLPTPTPAFAVKFSATKAAGNSVSQAHPIALQYGALSQCFVYAIPTALVNGQRFTVETPPVNLTGFTPTTEPVEKVVTISGSGFTSRTTVTFMGTTTTGVKSTVVKFVSPTELQATVPNAAVPGPFTVMNAKGRMTDLCSFDPQPVITKLSATKGRTGMAIKVYGGGFSNITALLIGHYPFTIYKEVNPTLIDATIPNGSLSGDIAVDTQWGDYTMASPFTVTLSITGFSPSSGSVGTVVDITGVGFNSSSHVKFGGVAASSTTHISPTELRATVPPKFKPGPITVTNTAAPAGTVSSAGSFS